MLIPIPSYSEEANAIYAFKTETGRKVQVVIDELNDDLLINKDIEQVTSWTCCNCPDFEFRGRHCKHIKSVLEYLTLVGIKYRIVENKQTTEVRSNELQTEK